MSDLAVLFPGQGSQEPTMRERVERVRPDLLQAVGEECFARTDEGTEWAQPAIFAASLAAWAERDDLEPPGWAAGHSLGEITALVVAGAVSEPSALDLVVLRGQLMGQAREGGMLAVMGPGAAELAPALAEAHGLVVANDNSPEQVVLSGPRDALPTAAVAVRETGLRATDLPVAGAFHSPLMAPAVAPFRAALDRVSFSPPRFPVISGVSAAPVEDPRWNLAEGMVRPVRWREVLLALHAAGARTFAEVGPGRVLTGLVKRTLPREAIRV